MALKLAADTAKFQPGFNSPWRRTKGIVSFYRQFFVKSDAGGVDAGVFSTWLEQTRKALKDGGGIDVPCGTCSSCCTSAKFVFVEADEVETIVAIGRLTKQEFQRPMMRNLVLGFDKHGACQMHTGKKCAIYDQRPEGCRAYDCRLLASVGFEASGRKKEGVNERVRRWRFRYPTRRDINEHRAVLNAAQFILENESHFGGNSLLRDQFEIAILAVKSYELFMDAGEQDRGSGKSNRPAVEQVLRTVEDFRGSLAA